MRKKNDKDQTTEYIHVCIKIIIEKKKKKPCICRYIHYIRILHIRESVTYMEKPRN